MTPFLEKESDELHVSCFESQNVNERNVSEVTIKGAEIITALGNGLDETWARMCSGESGIVSLDQSWPRRYQSEVAAQLPVAIRQTICPTPATRCFDLAHYVGKRVIANSGCDTNKMGLVFSSTKGDLVQLEDIIRHGRQHKQQHFNLAFLARDLASELAIRGPVMVVSNACASGLIAIIQAARILIKSDHLSSMLVIGADILTDFVMAGFSSLNALSTKSCRPYDKLRDGLSLGEGAGALILSMKNVDDKPALAVIRGWGVANDATHITAPSKMGEGLVRTLRASLYMAHWKPDDIHYINGHGTGTVYNDEMEAQAFNTVFGPSNIPVTSMKGYLGHTLGAAGIIESALCLKILSSRKIPGSLGCDTLGVTKPVYVPNCEIVQNKLERLITVKSGFGGINAALAMEAA